MNCLVKLAISVGKVKTFLGQSKFRQQQSGRVPKIFKQPINFAVESRRNSTIQRFGIHFYGKNLNVMLHLVTNVFFSCRSFSLVIDHSRNTITYHNALSLSPPKFCISIVFGVSWGHFNSQEKLKTMLMQNFGVTNKEHYGMLWYFLEWSIIRVHKSI